MSLFFSWKQTRVCWESHFLLARYRINLKWKRYRILHVQHADNNEHNNNDDSDFHYKFFKYSRDSDSDNFYNFHEGNHNNNDNCSTAFAKQSRFDFHASSNAIASSARGMCDYHVAQM